MPAAVSADGVSLNNKTGTSSRTRRFLFAGGGTGGHLYPALAIAERLEEFGPDKRAECLFVCSDRPLDSQILSREGVAHKPLSARPFGLAPPRLARFLTSWGRAVRVARTLIADQGPDVHVIAMGGYVCAPVVRAALIEGVPVSLVNLDAVPGKANRWIGSCICRRNAGEGRLFSAAPIRTAPGEAWERVPPIVRRSAVSAHDPATCRRILGLDPDTLTLMVSGGSQGAKSINDFMIRLSSGGSLRRWQILHQTGKGEQDRVSAAYTKAGVRCVVTDYCDRMGDWWGAADAAIGRAGAGTVAEAWANRVPTVFLPYPYHRDEHQRANVQPLLDAGGAVVARDLLDAEANVNATGPIVRVLMGDEGTRARMRGCIAHLGPANGAQQVAKILWQTGQSAGFLRAQEQ